MKASMAQKMLLWIKQKLKEDIYSDLDFKNLTDSFKSGLILCGMIHKFSPQFLDYTSLNKSDGLENLRKAIAVFESEWGIPRIIAPEDIYEAPDDKSMQLFLSYVIKKAQEYEKLNPSSDSNTTQTTTPTKTTTTTTKTTPIKTTSSTTPTKTTTQTQTTTNNTQKTTTTSQPSTIMGMFSNRATQSVTQPTPTNKTQDIKEEPKKEELKDEPKVLEQKKDEPKVVKKIVTRVVTKVVKKDSSTTPSTNTTPNISTTTTPSTSVTTPSNNKSSNDGFLSIEYLKTKPFGVDLSLIDQHLSPKDFEQVFGMTKEKWKDVPGWQKTAKRKQAGLF